MEATTVAVDLAKDVFQVAFANRAGRIIDRQRLTRRQFEPLLNGVVVDTEIIMELSLPLTRSGLRELLATS
jgi:hypothetical protein